MAGVVSLVMFPVWALPKPTGAFTVGVRAFEIEDPKRPGLFNAPAGAPRRLLVRVWYPAGEVGGGQPRPYFTQRESETTARTLGGMFGFPQFFAYLKHVKTNSYEDAPLIAGARELPVVFYSHGYTSFLGQNTALMEDLASHGYVIFSLQHTSDASDTLFLNGDVIPFDPDLIAQTQSAADDGPNRPQARALGGRTLDERLLGHIEYREQSAARRDRTVVGSARAWVEDRLFLHDALEMGAVPGPIAPIAEASSLSRTGEMGMSFGGATTGTLCMIDERCAAGINLDGGDFHFTAFNADMPVPFMMFHSDMASIYQTVERAPPPAPRGFNEFSYERIAAAGARPDIYRLQLKGALHLGLSDFSLFVRSPLRDPLFGSAPSEIMIGAQNAFVRGFFDQHLRGLAADFPKSELAAYKDWVVAAGNADLRAWWEAKSDAERASLESRITAARGAGTDVAAAPDR
jgi:predicted dienelactone hydrolase